MTGLSCWPHFVKDPKQEDNCKVEMIFFEFFAMVAIEKTRFAIRVQAFNGYQLLCPFASNGCHSGKKMLIAVYHRRMNPGLKGFTL